MILQNLPTELEKLKLDENYIVTLCEKLFLISDSKMAMEALEIILEFVKNNDMLTSTYAWLLHYKGKSHFNLFDFKTATDFLEEAYVIFVNNNNIDGQLASISAFVSAYSVQQKLVVAIKYGIDGIRLATKYGNYAKLVGIKSNLAALYMEIGEYAQGKDLLDQIEHAPYTPNKASQVICFTNQAECCTNLGDLEAATLYIANAYELSKEHVPRMVPNVLKEMAHIHAKNKQYDLADEIFAKSVEMAKKSHVKIFLQDALLYWADLDLVLGRHQDAIDKLKAIQSEIKDANSIRNLSRVYLYLSKGFKGLNKYEQAHYYLEKHLDLEGQMYTLRNAENIKSLDKVKEEEEEVIYKFLYNQLDTLYAIGDKVLSNLEKENILSIIGKEMQSLIQADGFQIVLHNAKKDTYENALFIEGGQRLTVSLPNISEDSFYGYSVKNKQDIFINNIEEEYSYYIKDFSTYLDKIKEKQASANEKIPHSLIFIPIIIKEKVIGVLSIQSYKKNAFGLKDLSTLKIISNYLGIGLENARLYEEVEYASKYDVLTNLINRRELFNQSNQVYHRLKNSPDGNQRLCVLMIDIDNFKRINDIHSHQEGDMVLESVANIIRESIDKDEIIGRYGGEEFMVAMPNKTKDHCIQKAELIRRNIENTTIKSFSNEPINVTTSVGGSNLDPKEFTLGTMINYADKELYKAKNAGRNQVSFL